MCSEFRPIKSYILETAAPAVEKNMKYNNQMKGLIMEYHREWMFHLVMKTIVGGNE